MTPAALNLFLVDADPVFRLGVRIWLQQQADFRVVGEAATGAAALQQLAALQTATTEGAAAASPTAAVDVVIVDIGLGQADPDQIPGLQLCRDLKRQFPQVGVLVLSADTAPVLQAAARQMGADGFGDRALPVSRLAQLIRQVAARSATAFDPEPAVALPEPLEGPIALLRRSALRQIEAEMAAIEAATRRRLPAWYRWVLAGNYRELRAARWLVQRLLPAPQDTTLPPPSVPIGRDRSGRPATATTAGPLAQSSPRTPVVVGELRSQVCEAVFRKLQYSLDNRSGVPLEIELLQPDRVRELLYIVLRAFTALLDDVQRAQLPPGQLPEKTPDLLSDLWETVLSDFFGRYYTPPIAGLEQPMVDVLRQEKAVVQAAILDRIPAVPSLLAHLLFQAPLEVDGASYEATTPEARRRSQFLLENLVIQVACAVMQPVLNQFADDEFLKRRLYQRRRLSTRDITRFRNDLSWRYRWETLIADPKAMFESQYRLFVLTPAGIQTHTIYAPRRDELDRLSGFQSAVTLLLEARDAIAPRLQTAIALVGRGIVFVLTELIGRGIGLIGRGIFKGIGNAWQESRIRQQRQD